MDSKIRQIKIKLDVPENTIAYNRLREQWENEGGTIGSNSIDDLIPADIIPFRSGEHYKVVTCQAEVIEDELFLLVDIEKVAEENQSLQTIDRN